MNPFLFVGTLEHIIERLEITIIGSVSSLWNIWTWHCFVQNLTVYIHSQRSYEFRGAVDSSVIGPTVLWCRNWKFNKTTCFVSLAGPAVLFGEISCEAGVWPALLILSKTNVRPALGVGARFSRVGLLRYSLKTGLYMTCAVEIGSAATNGLLLAGELSRSCSAVACRPIYNTELRVDTGS